MKGIGYPNHASNQEKKIMKTIRKQCVLFIIIVALISAGMWASYYSGVRKGGELETFGSFYLNLELYMQMYKMRAYINEVSPEKDGFITLGSARFLLWGALKTYDAHKADIDNINTKNSTRTRDRHIRLLEEVRGFSGDVSPVPLKPLLLEEIKAVEP